MRVRKAGTTAFIFGSLVLIGLCAPEAAHAGHRRTASHHGHAGHYARRSGHGRYAWGGGHLQCVPFARADSGIDLSGNAAGWWNEAAGVYERGSRPEPGAVLNFSANGRMRLGHVAVVSRVLNSREIEVDHANWWGPGSYGGVARGVPVVDVSPNNDWTAVRVGLDHNGDFGSIYPTHGFIYDRPDHGTLVANNTVAPQLVGLGAAPADLRPHVREASLSTTTGPIPYDEVAEAPADTDFRTTRVGHHHARHGHASTRHPTHSRHAARTGTHHRS